MAAAASGPPPKVVPRSPTCICAESCWLVNSAPQGMPPPSDFAAVRMSGSHAVMLHGEMAPGTAHAALNLVGDQDGARARRFVAQCLHELPGQVVGAGHALHRLEDHGGDAVVDHCPRSLDVVSRYEVDVERRVRESVPAPRGFPRYGARRRRAAMESVFDSEHLAATGRAAGNSKRVLVRFRAAVDEEGVGQAVRRDANQLLRGFGPYVQRHGVALEQEGWRSAR